MRALVFLLLASVAAGSAPARAADDEARKHFNAGIALVQKHDFAAALVELQASYDDKPLPETLFDIALCERELGRYADALAKLRRYLASLAPTDENQAKIREAQALIAQTEAQLPPPAPEAPPPPAPEVHAPPAPPPLVSPPVSPPPEAPTVVATVEPPPVHRPRLVDTMQGRAAIGLGAAALGLFIGGAATGGVVLADKHDYQASCDRVCDSALYGRARTLAITTDVLFAVGGAAAVTSLVLFLAHPHRSR
jgi:tetratricopeptide (TPR) repeat protein